MCDRADELDDARADQLDAIDEVEPLIDSPLWDRDE